MTSLDRFKIVFHEPDEACTHCDHEGDVFAFWERHDTRHDDGPDCTACVQCLFGMDGRFKNQPPASVLRKFEEITSINVTESHVVIGTRSPFGYYFHIHYTKQMLCPVADPVRDASGEFECRPALDGVSEIFTEDGTLIGAPSPYSHLAHRALTRNEVA